jgi:hypothetical protein
MTMAYVAIAVATVSTVYSIDQSQKAAKAQKEASRKQQAMQQLEASKNRQAAVKESRARRAQLQAQASDQGVVGSSGLGGAVSSSVANLGSNISFQNTQTAFNQSIASSQEDALQAQANAQMGGQIAGFASSFIDPTQLGTKK